MAGSVSQVIKQLRSKCKALSSKPSTTGEKKRTQKKKGRRKENPEHFTKMLKLIHFNKY
jgi:hypothetical protein